MAKVSNGAATRSRSRRDTSDSVDLMVSDWGRERPDLDAAPFGIIARVARINALVLRCAGEWLTPFGLTWESFSMLVTLRRSGRPYTLTPTRLYQESLLTSGAITSRIDRVVALGFAERLPDPSDRRGVLVKLTPAGKRLADHAIARHFDELDSLIGRLTKADRSDLSELLSKLLGSLESLPDPKARVRNGTAKERG